MYSEITVEINQVYDVMIAKGWLFGHNFNLLHPCLCHPSSSSVVVNNQASSTKASEDQKWSGQAAWMLEGGVEGGQLKCFSEVGWSLWNGPSVNKHVKNRTGN